jgi:hypothetical protein
VNAVMLQPGRGHRARGELLPPAPFVERSERTRGEEGDYCWCLVHFARALAYTEAGNNESTRRELAAGFGLVRTLDWIGFLRPHVDVVSRLCALALEHRIETGLVCRIIVERALQPPRRDVAGWP